MSTTKLDDQKKHYQQSRRALLPNGVIGLVATAVGAAAHVWWTDRGLSWWAWGVLLFLGWFGFVGDLINILYRRRRLAAAELDAAKKHADISS